MTRHRMVTNFSLFHSVLVKQRKAGGSNCRKVYERMKDKIQIYIARKIQIQMQLYTDSLEVRKER